MITWPSLPPFDPRYARTVATILRAERATGDFSSVSLHCSECGSAMSACRNGDTGGIYVQCFKEHPGHLPPCVFFTCPDASWRSFATPTMQAAARWQYQQRTLSAVA